MDHAPVSAANRFPLWRGLGYSLLLHAALLIYLGSVWPPEQSTSAVPLLSRLSVTLKQQPVLEEIVLRSLKKLARPNLQQSEPLASVPTVAPALSLDLPGLAQQPEYGGETKNGATIMDSRLLATLNQAKRVFRLDDSMPEKLERFSNYDAGVWTDAVEINGMCFHVRRSNPLEPLSSETWYRVRCPN